jgi:hypothetical protein
VKEYPEHDLRGMNKILLLAFDVKLTFFDENKP